MKFHLKVHSIVGVMGGGAGPIGAAAGTVGMGAAGINGPGAFGLTPLEALEYGGLIGLIAASLPGGIIGGMGGYLSGFAKGDSSPAFGTGVSGPGGSPGVGGGPAAFTGSTLVQRALTVPAAAAPVLAKPPVAKPKAPVKKRTGRQETILTGGLSEGTTFKPTLLGQ